MRELMGADRRRAFPRTSESQHGIGSVVGTLNGCEIAAELLAVAPLLRSRLAFQGLAFAFQLLGVRHQRCPITVTVQRQG
jgi:hypothetical protein